MIQFIKTKERENRQVVSARELHSWLDTRDHFTQWAKRMFEHGFIEGVDYEAIHKFVKHENGFGGTNKTDYALTIDCAKEISMIQKTEKGKQARQYFIACEEKLKYLSEPQNYIEALRQLIDKVEREERLKQC